MCEITTTVRHCLLQEPTIADEMCGMCPNLTFQQRVIGFAVCLGLGYLLSFMSTVSLWTADLTGFALLYCLGSLIAIGATGYVRKTRNRGSVKTLTEGFGFA